MNDFGSARLISEAPTAALAPVEAYLADLHARVSKVTGGSPADYIPELGKAEPSLFGIAIATVDGQIYAAGDADVPFTIQSVSKPFMYGYALQRYGRLRVLEQVGVSRPARRSTRSCSTRWPTDRSTPWSMPAPSPLPR